METFFDVKANLKSLKFAPVIQMKLTWQHILNLFLTDFELQSPFGSNAALINLPH